MIVLNQVAKRYRGGVQALRNVNLTIAPSEFLFITGHSGAGKSTLLKLIAAIEFPTVGSVIINGQNTSALRRGEVPFLRRNFGIIFQDHKLLYDRSVYDNVLLPLRICGFDHQEAAKRVRAALNKVGLLGKEKMDPITLSGGEQQRLCVARAIVSRPAVLIADEPTANLDTAYAADIMDMFKSFNQVGVTVIIATHDQAMLQRYAPRIVNLRQGELVPPVFE